VGVLVALSAGRVNIDAVLVDNRRGGRRPSSTCCAWAQTRCVHQPCRLAVADERRAARTRWRRRPGFDPPWSAMPTSADGGAAASGPADSGGVFTAIVATNDLMAIGAMETGRRGQCRASRGRRFRDTRSPRSSSLVSPRLPSPSTAWGAMMERPELLAAALRPRRMVLEPELIVRDSVEPVATSNDGRRCVSKRRGGSD
jgi:DNA-binding LacI/PurR family transcriptional regulator